MIAEVLFRFDEAAHEYVALDTGQVLPHVTGLLERAGWIDDTWYTAESCERGTEIHRITASYDLGALDPETYDGPYRGYLLSHVKAMSIMRATILSVEEPLVHPTYRFGGRPDRVLIAWGLRAVLDGKSGAPAKSHMIQTALQAILDSTEANLRPENIGRFALYWQANGTFKLEEHKSQSDFREAFRILKEYR